MLVECGHPSNARLPFQADVPPETTDSLKEVWQLQKLERPRLFFWPFSHKCVATLHISSAKSTVGKKNKYVAEQKNTCCLA